MKKLLFAASFIILASLGNLAYAQSGKLKWLDGTWNGVGYQPGLKSQWEVKLVVNSAENTISISYPDLDCSGNWQIMKVKKRRISEFKEVILEGRDKCLNDLKVLIHLLDKEYLSVSYFISGTDKLDAFTVLKKQKKN